MTGWGISCVNVGPFLLFCLFISLWREDFKLLLESAQGPVIIIKEKCVLKFQDVEHLSCVTEIGLRNSLEQAWTLPASEDICRADPSNPSLAFSFLADVFFPSFFLFCPLLLPGEPMPSTQNIAVQSLPAFGCLPISVGSWNIFPSLFLLPERATSSHISIPVQGNHNCCHIICCHLPEISYFSISLSPVLQLSVANLMLVHVLVSQYPLYLSNDLLNKYLGYGFMFGINWFTIILLTCPWPCAPAFSTHTKSLIVGPCSEVADSIKQKTNHFFPVHVP